MTRLFRVIFTAIAFFLSGVIHSDPVPELGYYWQCTARDNANKQWVFQSPWQLTALNRAFDLCKKQSSRPGSCKTSRSDCEGFLNGRSTQPLWRCTALDPTGTPWFSDLYPDRDEAAFAAKAYCQENSASPEACYTNLLTCININSME